MERRHHGHGKSGEILSVGSVAELLILFWWFLFIMNDRWSARVYIGVSVLPFSSYQHPTFQYLATCLPSHKFNNHTIMASLPDDQITKPIGFIDVDVDGTILAVGSITPSDQTKTIRSSLHRATAEGGPPGYIELMRMLETQSMRHDVASTVRGIRNSRATTNATNTAAPSTNQNPSQNPSIPANEDEATTNNQNPSTSATENKRMIGPELPPGFRRQ